MAVPGRNGRRRTAGAKFIAAALRPPLPTATPDLLEAAREVSDWDDLAELCIQNGVAPWVLACVQGSELAEMMPEEALNALRGHSRASALRTLTLSQALEEVLLELGSEGIGAAVLKGPAIAERFYPDAGLRPYGDIDLLVPRSAHDVVTAVCQRLGYVVAQDHGGVEAAMPGTCEAAPEISYVNQEKMAVLDIHYDHLQVGLEPRSMKGAWERCEPWTFQRASARAPALNDLFLFLAVHLHRHGFERAIWFKDLDLIVRREGERLDWRWLAEAAREEGVTTLFGTVLRLLQRLLGTPLPEETADLVKAGQRNPLHRLLWREDRVLNLDTRSHQWRRGIVVAPAEGLRGALPSLLLMGRRGDKLSALLRRTLSRTRRAS
jgi:hypothetical protein